MLRFFNQLGFIENEISKVEINCRQLNDVSGSTTEIQEFELNLFNIDTFLGWCFEHSFVGHIQRCTFVANI